MSIIRAIKSSACLQTLLVFLVFAAESYASDKSEEFEGFIDRYLEFTWESNPERATRSGIHDYDAQSLDDVTSQRDETMLKLAKLLYGPQ